MLTALLAFGVGVHDCRAQPLARAGIDRLYRDELERLVVECQTRGLLEQARITKAALVPRPPDRQVIFLLPQSAPRSETDEAERPAVAKWRESFAGLRQAQADRLWTLAQAALDEHHNEQACQLLFEILREDPEHEQARRILQFAVEGGDPAGGFRHSVPKTRHPDLGWPAGEYRRIHSKHFTITTNHTAAAARHLAEVLEELHQVWSQLFVRHWTSSKALARAFAGGALTWPHRRSHQVVLFATREEYVRHLKPREPQVEMTRGMYRDAVRTAFFYAGEDSPEPTWRHEATHQLWQEVGDAERDVGAPGNFWVVEAVALYMESAVKYDGYYTLGGPEAPRLQVARYRLLTENYSVPLAQLVSLGKQAMQSNPDLRRLYTQSAGLAHFFMDGQAGRYREAFVQQVHDVYRSGGHCPSIAEQTGRSFEVLDDEYRSFLSSMVEEPSGDH
jgi:hypothetical protein